jgi:hypothetical protein
VSLLFWTVGISGKEEGTNDMMIKRELGYIGASQETRGNNWCVSRLFEVYQGSPPVRLSGHQHGRASLYIPRIVSAPFYDSFSALQSSNVVLYKCWTSRIRTGWRRRLSSTPMSRFQFVRPPLRFPPSALLTVIMHIWFELLYMSRQCATCRQPIALDLDLVLGISIHSTRSMRMYGKRRPKKWPTGRSSWGSALLFRGWQLFDR